LFALSIFGDCTDFIQVENGKNFEYLEESDINLINLPLNETIKLRIITRFFANFLVKWPVLLLAVSAAVSLHLTPKQRSSLTINNVKNLYGMFEVACNNIFKQRGTADFPTSGNSILAKIVNAARQFHMRRASADVTTLFHFNIVRTTEYTEW
jgi:hypothetical protein